MIKYVISKQAERDIINISLYISKRNPAAATEIESKIIAAFSLIAEYPSIGTIRIDFTKRDVRFFPIEKNYIIIYNHKVTPIRILRILHVALDAVRVIKE